MSLSENRLPKKNGWFIIIFPIDTVIDFCKSPWYQSEKLTLDRGLSQWSPWYPQKNIPEIPSYIPQISHKYPTNIPWIPSGNLPCGGRFSHLCGAVGIPCCGTWFFTKKLGQTGGIPLVNSVFTKKQIEVPRIIWEICPFFHKKKLGVELNIDINGGKWFRVESKQIGILSIKNAVAKQIKYGGYHWDIIGYLFNKISGFVKRKWNCPSFSENSPWDLELLPRQKTRPSPRVRINGTS